MRRTTLAVGTTTGITAVALSIAGIINLANPARGPSAVETPAVAAASTTPLQLDVVGVQDGYTPAQPFATPPAGFRWVAIDVRITNPGRTAMPVAGLLDLTIIDPHGMQYPVHPQPGSRARIEGEIRPGGTKHDTVVFQLPSSVSSAQLVLQSQAGSVEADLAL